MRVAMRTRAQRVAFGVLVVGALLACKKKAAPEQQGPTDAQREAAALAEQKAKDDALAAKRGSVKLRVAAISKLAEAMKTAPKVKADGVKGAPGGIVLTVSYRDSPGQNAALVFEEDLADLASSKTGGLVLLDARFAENCAEFASGERPDDDQTLSKKCEGLEYALVFRPRVFKKAEVRPDKKAFVTGEIAGEVHVFRIDGAQRVGGFTVAVENADSVDFRGQEPDYYLEKDLITQFETALAEKLAGLGK